MSRRVCVNMKGGDKEKYTTSLCLIVGTFKFVFKKQKKARRQLAIPKARSQLAVPKARSQLAIPKTRRQLAVPKARRKLAVPKARRQLAIPKARRQLAVPGRSADSLSDFLSHVSMFAVTMPRDESYENVPGGEVKG